MIDVDRFFHQEHRRYTDPQSERCETIKASCYNAQRHDNVEYKMNIDIWLRPRLDPRREKITKIVERLGEIFAIRSIEHLPSKLTGH